MKERDNIRDNVLVEYFKYNPDYLVTACPLCKKTFSKGNDFPVYDIAEILTSALNRQTVCFTKELCNYDQGIIDKYPLV